MSFLSGFDGCLFVCLFGISSITDKSHPLHVVKCMETYTCISLQFYDNERGLQKSGSFMNCSFPKNGYSQAKESIPTTGTKQPFMSCRTYATVGADGIWTFLPPFSRSCHWIHFSYECRYILWKKQVRRCVLRLFVEGIQNGVSRMIS